MRRQALFAVALVAIAQSGLVLAIDTPHARAADVPDPVRDAILDVTLTEYEQLVDDLVGFGNRLTGSTQNDDAAAWIKAEFEAAGLATSYDPFSNSQNIIGVKAPADGSSDGYIVVGGHMDGVSAATGGAAEDNGSGTAALIALARAFDAFDVDTEIRFIAFSGEEQGLYGSTAYADRAHARGDDVVAMFNADMIAYNPDGELRMKVLKNDPSTWLANHAVTTLDAYQDVLGLESLVLQQGAANSDHYPFWANGYPAVFFHSYSFSPEWHKATDTPATLNFTYGLETTRLLGASLGSLAGLHYRGDAIVTGLEVANPDAREGDAVTVHATVANPGPGPLPDVDVALTVDGAEVARQSVPLAPGTPQALTFTWDATGFVGDHTLAVVADPDEAVRELDETNNVASTGLVLDAPDLVAHAPTDAEWEPEGFGVFRVTFTAAVENVRGPDARAFTVGFYHDEVTPENLFATVPVDGVAGGARVNVTATWDGSQSGDRTIIVVADDAADVPEWEDANNAAAETFPLFMGFPWKADLPDPSAGVDPRDEDGDGVPRAWLYWEEHWVNGSGLGTQTRDEGEWRDSGVGDPDE